MRRDEGGIETKRFVSEDSNCDFYPRLTKALQSITRYTGEGVRDGDDDARDALLENESRAPASRRSLTRGAGRAPSPSG